MFTILRIIFFSAFFRAKYPRKKDDQKSILRDKLSLTIHIFGLNVIF
jgi:hypothetical protein